MADDWQFYFCHRDGKIASVAVNLGFEAIAPDASRPWLVGIRIKMKSPNPNGLSGASEGAAFDGIQGRLNAAFQKELGAVAIGVVTSAGWWEFYYQARHATGFPVFLTSALGEFVSYERMTYSKDDKSWGMYRSVLVPSEEKMNQQIINREVIQNLRNLGWDQKKPLRVDHVLLLPTAEKRNEGMGMAQQEGYEVTDQFELESGEAQGFALQISRNVVPEEHSMQAVVFHLIDLAGSLGGKYDGWGAMVTR